MILGRKYRCGGFDIETSNLRADMGHVLAAVFKPLDGDPIVLRIDDYPGEGLWDDKPLVKKIREVCAEFNQLFGWYSANFDVKFLRSRSLLNNLHVQPVTFRHCDLWRVGRSQFLWTNNRLATYMEIADAGQKDYPRKEEWRRAALGHRPSLDKIVERCVSDVVQMEAPFLMLEPSISSWQQVVI